MKKRICLLTLSVLLTTLAGCNDNIISNDSSVNSETSSSEVSTPSESNSSSEVSVPITKDVAYIYNALVQMANTSNYELTYELNGMTYHDIYNEHYVYFGYGRNGGILVDSYNPEEIPGKLLYQYEIDDQNNVNFLSALLDDEGLPVDNTQIFDFMMLVNDPRYDVSQEDIVDAGNGRFYTDDKNLILILATVLGYYEYAIYDLFDRVIFTIADSGDLTVTLQMYDTEGNLTLVDVDSATFSNIGHAKLDIMEEYYQTYKLPETKLSSSLIGDISNNIVSTHSEITLHYGEDEPSVIGTSDVDINGQYLKVVSTDLQSNTSATSIYKNIDGKANLCGLNPKNEPVTVSYDDIAWDELNWPSENMDCLAIRQTSDNTYHYYGLYADALAYSLTYMNLDTVKSIDFEVSNNKLSKMYIEFSESLDEQTNTVYHYSMVTDFVNVREISEPKPHSVDETENNKIKASFDNLTAGHRFRVTSYDFDGYTTNKYVTTVVNNVILVEETTDSGTVSYGWVEKEGQVIPFRVERDKSLKVIGECVEGDTLDNHLDFKLSSEVFTIKQGSDLRYVPKPNLIGLEDYLFNSPFIEGMIPDSLSMIVNDDGYITRMVYNYEVDILSGQTISGTAFIDIDQYNTAKLTNAMTAAIEALEAL